MILIHKGIRPKHQLALLNPKKQLYYEEYPDGRWKVWTMRQLNSGCDGVTRKPVVPTLEGCIYCKYCDEWFSEDQWEITYE